MKKSTVKRNKLTLNRETLRALERSEIEAVIGGASTDTACLTTCVGTCGRTCNTQNTCGTQFC
jgi:hypothetical protein